MWPNEIFGRFHYYIFLNKKNRSEKLTISMVLFIWWFDHRLHLLQKTNKSIFMDSSDYKKIWTPLFLIRNLVDLHEYDLESRETMIYGMRQHDSNDLAGFKITYFRATVFCGMNFEKFPFDQQSCHFEVFEKLNKNFN